MARQTVSLLVAAALLLALSASVSAQRTVVVSNNEEAARALASQDVSIIRLAYSESLPPALATRACTDTRPLRRRMLEPCWCLWSRQSGMRPSLLPISDLCSYVSCCGGGCSPTPLFVHRPTYSI